MTDSTSTQRLMAWSVHLYTAIGGVVGMFALFAAADGDIPLAFILLVFSMVIDSTDGIMARRARVSEVLPYFDGAMVDNVIDMLTFVWIPVFIMWREALLPHELWTIVPMLAGMYAYGQVNMKTDDSFFLGFPSYWNVVALYLFWFNLPDVLTIAFIVVPAILTFIPTRYLYPSKNYVFWRITWGLGVIWFLLVFWLLLQDDPSEVLIILSFYYPVYYMVMSFYIEYRIWMGERAADIDVDTV